MPKYLVARHASSDEGRIFVVGLEEHENEETAYEVLMCMDEPMFDDHYYMVIEVVGDWKKFYHREERSYIKNRVIKYIP
jgi:hypothetical protein